MSRCAWRRASSSPCWATTARASRRSPATSNGLIAPQCGSVHVDGMSYRQAVRSAGDSPACRADLPEPRPPDRRRQRGSRTCSGGCPPVWTRPRRAPAQPRSAGSGRTGRLRGAARPGGSPADRSSGWRWPACWPAARATWSATSRRRCSTALARRGEAAAARLPRPRHRPALDHAPPGGGAAGRSPAGA